MEVPDALVPPNLLPQPAQVWDQDVQKGYPELEAVGWVPVDDYNGWGGTSEVWASCS